MKKAKMISKICNFAILEFYYFANFLSAGKPETSVCPSFGFVEESVPRATTEWHLLCQLSWFVFNFNLICFDVF